MKLIVCVDDNCGVLFNNRRISSDKAVIKHMLNLIAGGTLVCSGYSAGLFPDGRINVREDFGDTSSDMTYYFLEGQDPTSIADQVRELVVYRWNRIYPSDYRFPMDLFYSRMRRVSQGQFQGNSHDVITWEVYRL